MTICFPSLSGITIFLGGDSVDISSGIDSYYELGVTRFNHKNYQPYSEEEYPVSIFFNDVEAIDSFIRCLERTKQQLSSFLSLTEDEKEIKCLDEGQCIYSIEETL